MGRLKIVISFVMLVWMNVYSYDSVLENTDEKTIAWVNANTASQSITNSIQNQQVDSIKKRQTKLAEVLGIISANKLLLQQTYKNVSGFKEESLIYKSIAKTGTNILTHSGQAIDAINKSKLTGKAWAIVRVGSLVADAVSFGKFFADVVANGKVKNPFKDPEAMSSSGDGANLLNRHDRLKMANDLLRRLKDIDLQLMSVTRICRFASAEDLLREIDRDTYLNMLTAKRHMSGILDQWKALKN